MHMATYGYTLVMCETQQCCNPEAKPVRHHDLRFFNHFDVENARIRVQFYEMFDSPRFVPFNVQIVKVRCIARAPVAEALLWLPVDLRADPGVLPLADVDDGEDEAEAEDDDSSGSSLSAFGPSDDDGCQDRRINNLKTKCIMCYMLICRPCL